MMKYTTSNIGDEIQSIAAQRFLPHIDYYIDREYLNSFHNDNHEKAKIILNGWFMDIPDNFPPSDEIFPLLVSMHLYHGNREKLIMNGAVRDYLIHHGPVGCRDKSTMNFLLEHDVPAYFSGCMTTTMIPNMKLKRRRENEYILCVNVKDEVYAHVKEKARRPVFRITKKYIQSDSMKRFKWAKMMLFMYHQASSVITMNLHTALPCLAFGTPVCLIEQEKYDGRFDGLDDLLFHCSEHEFINGFYDIDNPPANKDSFIDMRNSLVETCRAFTGFDAGVPTLEDDYAPDMLSLLDILSMYGRAVNYEGGRRLLKEVLKKAIHKFFPSIVKDNPIISIIKDE
ncbi:MAG: polysaccharide pyruvyl transferase family protein [Synergistaceae bacterium]|nr:polysaccharide pyruvyl transferase family protein [Synergistaceae bacterium]